MGVREPWIPLKAVLFAGFVNLVGDIVLCIGFGMGIHGAAIATAAAQYVSSILLVRSLLNYRTHYLT